MTVITTSYDYNTRERKADQNQKKRAEGTTDGLIFCSWSDYDNHVRLTNRNCFFLKIKSDPFTLNYILQSCGTRLLSQY